MPAPADTPPTDLDARIRDAYAQLAKRHGDYVPLAALRDKLPDIAREDLDRALTALLDSDGRLEQEPFGHRVGAADKAAALHIGGENVHKLALNHGVPQAPPAVSDNPELDRIKDVLHRARQLNNDAAARQLMLDELPGNSMRMAGGLLDVDRHPNDGPGTLADRYLAALRKANP